jgi:hypothetical protein
MLQEIASAWNVFAGGKVTVVVARLQVQSFD